jgi:hypothetical protein
LIDAYLEVVRVGLAQLEVLLEDIQRNGWRHFSATQELPIESVVCRREI